MHLRIWRAIAAANRADAYPDHFRDHVVPALAAVPGFEGAELASRELGDRLEFIVISRWRSLDAIRGFAGDDYETAVVEPGAVAALLSYDDRVQHFELVASTPGGAPAE